MAPPSYHSPLPFSILGPALSSSVFRKKTSNGSWDFYVKTLNFMTLTTNPNESGQPVYASALGHFCSFSITSYFTWNLMVSLSLSLKHVVASMVDNIYMAIMDTLGFQWSALNTFSFELPGFISPGFLLGFCGLWPFFLPFPYLTFLQGQVIK